jgi:phosphate transport system permease protein
VAQATIEIRDLRGSDRRRRKELLIKGVFFGAALISVLVSALIIISLVGQAISFLRTVELSKLWGDGWFPRRGEFDIKTIFVGSVIVSAIAMVVAAPLGLGAAVYLSEYARPPARRFLKPILEVLAGIPSVVLGFFALTWISPELVRRFAEGATGSNLAAAGIGVGVLVTPLVASIAEDAMRAVPMSLREASYGLGARKRTVTSKIVFPAAVSGIVAALIIGVSRAIGETMVVAIAAGGTGGSLFNVDPTKPGQTMTGAMASVATGSDQVHGAEGTFASLFFVGLLLFVLTLALNIISDRFVRRTRMKY